jgi:hypothetical protein
MKYFSSCIRRSQRILLGLLASSAVFTAGCANMATTAGGSGFVGEAATMGGTVHGGNQPVASAVINLWFAGQGGGAVLAATTTSASDGTGSFSFVKAASGGNTGTTNTFSCPSSNVLVYVTAIGGNTQNNGDATRNTASVFLAPFGPCGNITTSSFVDLTEVTTVATMAVWQQYFNPSVPAATAITNPVAGSFDSDGTGLSLQSMTASYNLLANLVNLATGTAYTTKTIPASTAPGTVFVSGLSVVATPETAKINTIANILAACINTATYTPGSGPCDTLFTNAPAPDPTTTAEPGATFAAATDTLHAAYYMLTNPTNTPAGTTTSKLGNLFGLVLANGAPFLPTLGTQPSDWTIGISYAGPSTLCGATTGSTGHLINSVQDIAIDNFGGVWLANNETGGNVALLASNGAPEGCIKIGSGLNTGITLDAFSTGGLQNVWVADSGGNNVYKYPPTTTSFLAYPTGTAAPTSITADGTGNIYYTSNGNLYELPQAVTTTPVTPVSIATVIGTGSRVLVDSAPSIWTTSGTTSITHTVCTTPNSGTGCTPTAITTVGPTYGIGVTPFITVGTAPSTHQQNSVYFSAGTGTSSVSLFQGGPATTYGSVTGWPITSGLSTPAALAVDGAQNVWAINNGAPSVVEIGASKQLLSGSTGFVKDVSYLGSGRSLVIDSSGNVWIGLDGATSVTEIVGAAVPVYQPYALGLHNSTFQIMP